MTEEEGQVTCSVCGKVSDVSELVYWRHGRIDGGRYYLTCPCCARRASRTPWKNSYRTAVKLIRCFHDVYKEASFE